MPRLGLDPVGKPRNLVFSYDQTEELPGHCHVVLSPRVSTVQNVVGFAEDLTLGVIQCSRIDVAEPVAEESRLLQPRFLR